MKEIKNMSLDELKNEIKHIVSLLDDQPEHHAAYLADLADELASRVAETF